MPEDYLLNVIVIVVSKKLLFGRSVNDHGSSLDSDRSESVVLFAVAFCFIHRIFLAVRGEFPSRRFVEVNAEYAAEANQIHQYVRQFVLNGLADFGVCGGGDRIGIAHPLENLTQLSYLAGESQDEIFGGVELLPVAIICETLKGRGKLHYVDQWGG
jgi:hypothetical protein